MNFAQRLETLPPIDGIVRLVLRDAQDREVATIENLPGKAGSLRVYHAPGGATQRLHWARGRGLGLQWFAEHVADAQANPGKHPNIDRLIAWAAGSAVYRVQVLQGVRP